MTRPPDRRWSSILDGTSACTSTEASAKGLTIDRVIETHVHADFVGGHLELARSGREPHLLRRRGQNSGSEVEHLLDGERMSFGEVTFEVLATPGHTPESICVVVLRTSRRRRCPTVC